jgi:uncharacterized ubiquitin-like protein YukD
LTLYDRGNREIGDMELPVKVQVKDLSVKLAATLREMDPDRFSSIQNLKILYNDKVLEEEDTLYQNGIWDGSKIRLMY